MDQVKKPSNSPELPPQSPVVNDSYHQDVSSFDEFKADPKPTLQDTAATLGSFGTSALSETLKHVPGLGLPVAIARKVLIKSELSDVSTKITELKKNIGQILNRLNSGSKSESLKDLSTALLYALNQKERHQSKSKFFLAGTNLNIAGGIATIVGASAGGIGAIPGIAVSATGSAIQGGVTARSIYNYVRKTISGELGRERIKHAKLIYDMASERLTKIYSKPKSDADHFKACEIAHNLLIKMGVLDPKNPEDFKRNGYVKTAVFLRSRN